VKCLQHSSDPWCVSPKANCRLGKANLALSSYYTCIHHLLVRSETTCQEGWWWLWTKLTGHILYDSVCFKACTVSIRKSSHLYSVDYLCTEASQLFALDRPLLQSRNISLREHRSVPCQVACVKCFSLSCSFSLFKLSLLLQTGLCLVAFLCV